MCLGSTQNEFAQRYDIPFRTIQNWETGERAPSEYVVKLLETRVKEDLINRKTMILPKYDPHKRNLPERSDFIGAISWLKAVRDCIDEDIVFALDEALMCQGNFGGRSDEYTIWVYGQDDVTRFNGVVVIGNEISDHNVVERNGLKFTNFNRTIVDALANEDILDMQGTMEAINRYYYRNGETLEGIFVSPEYQEPFDRLAKEAIGYYEN